MKTVAIIPFTRDEAAIERAVATVLSIPSDEDLSIWLASDPDGVVASMKALFAAPEQKEIS